MQLSRGVKTTTMNALEKLNSIKGQMAYAQDVLNNGGLELWEVKEYNGLIDHYKSEISTLTAYVDSLPHIFK